MNNISNEVIEIDGKEYTLFLNRKGIVAYERYCKDEYKQFNDAQDKLEKTIEALEAEEVVINDDTNPFEGLEDINDNGNISIDELVHRMYIKLYWIMLYKNYNFSLKKVEELYDKATAEYGESQVRALGDQMVEEVNAMPEKVKQENLKNLKALKPKK